MPEPEVALVISPDLRLVAYSIGNDVSARDIEGENPLYLPQAKCYRECAGLGPCVLLADKPLDRAGTSIVLEIERDGGCVFRGETDVDRMARSFEDLIGWLGRENVFPTGVILMTGTGVVPPDEFTLENGDIVSISITGIGTLSKSRWPRIRPRIRTWDFMNPEFRVGRRPTLRMDAPVIPDELSLDQIHNRDCLEGLAEISRTELGRPGVRRSSPSISGTSTTSTTTAAGCRRLPGRGVVAGRRRSCGCSKPRAPSGWRSETSTPPSCR